MNPSASKNPAERVAPQPASPPAKEPKKSLTFDLKEVLPKIKKLWQKLTAHLSFIVIMIVLLVYLIVVWQIRGLATAEPSIEAESAALSSTNIPKIDKKAIDQIQALEENSPAIKSLFNEARNNPFHE